MTSTKMVFKKKKYNKYLVMNVIFATKYYPVS